MCLNDRGRSICGLGLGRLFVDAPGNSQYNIPFLIKHNLISLAPTGRLCLYLSSISPSFRYFMMSVHRVSSFCFAARDTDYFVNSVIAAIGRRDRQSAFWWTRPGVYFILYFIPASNIAHLPKRPISSL